MEELLKEIGINKTGQYSQDNSYIIDILNYDEFGKIFSELEQADQKEIIQQIDDSIIVNMHTTSIAYIYESDDNTYSLLLQADLDNDIYKLIITEV